MTSWLEIESGPSTNPRNIPCARGAEEALGKEVDKRGVNVEIRCGLPFSLKIECLPQKSLAVRVTRHDWQAWRSIESVMGILPPKRAGARSRRQYRRLRSYGVASIPDATMVVNPAYRAPDGRVRKAAWLLNRQRA